MKKTDNSGIYSAIISLLLLLWSGCSTEEQLFENPSHVQANFNLKSPAAMNGKVFINDAYLKLDRIQAIGNGETHTNITHPIPAEEPPFQLSKTDSSRVKFRLPGRAYESLDFHLFLIPDPYQLVFREPVAEGPPPPDGNDGQDTGGEDHTGGENTGGDIEAPPGDNDSNEGEENTPPATDGEADDDDDDDRDDGDDDSDREDSDDDSDDDQSDHWDGDDDDDDDEEGDSKQKDKKKKKNKGDKDRDDDDDEDDGDDDRDDGRRSSADGTATPDLDHFFQNARPGLLITGTYENNGRTISIIFVSSGVEKITVRASQNDAPFVRLNEYNNAEIIFDAASWFQAIGPEDIESAHIQVYQQGPVLFIHRDFNHQLYELLAPRLQAATTLTVQARETGIF